MFDFDALHRIEKEYINISAVIKENNLSFEKRFLNGYKHYNQCNNPADQRISCLVYLDFPDTTMNVIQFIISYDEFVFWMDNVKIIDFVTA